MSLCGKISKNQSYCDVPVIGGTEAMLYLFNRDEWASYVRDEDNPQIILEIVMGVKTKGTPDILYKGYKYEGYNTSVKPKSALVVKEFGNKFDHTVDFVVFSRGSDTKKELEALANGRYIAVIENLQKNDDVAFEILGTDVGLVLKVLTSDPNDTATEGAYVLQLGSPETFKEPHLPATLFDTDYATTKASLLAIVTA